MCLLTKLHGRESEVVIRRVGQFGQLISRQVIIFTVIQPVWPDKLLCLVVFGIFEHLVCKTSKYKQLFTQTPVVQIVHFVKSTLHSLPLINCLFITICA